MTSILSKPVTEITLQDVQELVGVPESDRLDFKREAYKHGDDDTREMLRDISSFANAAGGHLLLGVDEDDEDRATDIVGIDNAEQEASRILSSCRANIEEHIIGLSFGLVPVTERRQVLVWHIPRSTRAPHMITFKGSYQCWKRHGRQKDRMSIEEIREACLRTENVRRNLEDFLAERREKVLAQIRGIPWLLVTATPLVVKDELIETGDQAVRNLMADAPNPHDIGWTVDCGEHNIRPSLYGLAGELQDWHRLDVFRNGHAEFRVAVLVDPCEPETVKTEQRTTHSAVHPHTLAWYPLNFLHFVRALSDHCGIMEPAVVGLSIFNAKGLALRSGRPGTFHWQLKTIGETKVWDSDQHLELPPMQFPYPLDPGKVAKRLADMLWNAFGYESCPVLDQLGQPVLSK